jgi:DNA topoisomerase VI subunit A
MVEIAEQEASEAKINASRAIYLSIPTNELSADQQSKRQRLIASIEADLGLQ